MKKEFKNCTAGFIIDKMIEGHIVYLHHGAVQYSFVKSKNDIPEKLCIYNTESRKDFTDITIADFVGLINGQTIYIEED